MPETRRRWRRLAGFGFGGILVGAILGGLILDEFPPVDSDLFPPAGAGYSGPDDPFRWDFAKGDLELPEFLFVDIEELDSPAVRAWRNDPEIALLRDELSRWCHDFEHEFQRVGGDPWWRTATSTADPGIDAVTETDLALPAEVPLLSELDWIFGDHRQSIRWASLHTRNCLWAMATARTSSQWDHAQAALVASLDSMRRWIARGMLLELPSLDPATFAGAPPPWGRKARLFHREIVLRLERPGGIEALLRFRASDLIPRRWRWKPNRFRRRFGEVVRRAIEQPETSIAIKPDSSWVRGWIDPYGTGVLREVAAILEDSRHDFLDVEAGLAAVRISFAITAFERDRDRWPATLDELVPTYLPAVPPGPPVILDPGDRTLAVQQSGGAGLTDFWFVPARAR